MTSLPLFGHKETALGDFTCERENEIQMKKFKMFQKLDKKTFRMRYIGLNFARGEASKSGCEVALRIEEILLGLLKNPVFA